MVTLANVHGMSVRFMSRGGIILAVFTPDRDGTLADIVLGHNTLAEYAHDPHYFGALVGRNANRIANGAFTLDGVPYALSRNDGVNHLHGGTVGFSAHEWNVALFEGADAAGADLSLMSPDGDQGYPGALAVRVRYTLTNDNALRVDYWAETTAATPVNLTQHSYFNLSGCPGTTVLDHELTLRASRFTPVDTTLIPTGDVESVHGTPFDFTVPRVIGAHVGDRDPQLALARGYDHNFVLDDDGRPTRPAAVLTHPASGRILEITTTEPAVQMYSGNVLDRVACGKGGAPYLRHAGVALETQHYPDAPNQSHFPSTILRPGARYASTTVYRAGVVAATAAGS